MDRYEINKFRKSQLFLGKRITRDISRRIFLTKFAANASPATSISHASS